MKKVIQSVIVTALLICAPAFTYNVFADQPPDPGGGPGTGDPVGGGSPIGGGLLIMVALGAAYSGKKVYDARKKLLQ